MNFPSLSYIHVAGSPALDLGPLMSWHQIFPINEKILNLELIKLYQLLKKESISFTTKG